MQGKEITGQRIRAARGALKWSVQLLAKKLVMVSPQALDTKNTPDFQKQERTISNRLFFVQEASGIEFIVAPDDTLGMRIQARKD